MILKALLLKHTSTNTCTHHEGPNVMFWLHDGSQVSATNMSMSGPELFTLKVSWSHLSAATSLALLPDQYSAAKVLSRAPSLVRMETPVRVSVSLSSFSMVYTPAEVTLLMGAERIPVATVDYSNSLVTMISFFSPLMVAGTRTFSVHPTRLPENSATFTLKFVDR
jgi:hypothetical protein